MTFLNISIEENVAVMTLNRPKVNAINEAFAEELMATFQEAAKDANIKAIVLTGTGGFFSFGFDIPEFLSYPKEDFLRFANKFTELYTYLFLYPKPVFAALNGHTIAGGCMLATACDCRIIASGKPKIGLNEITFGSSIFPGSVEMLVYWVGTRNAEIIAFTGALYSAEEAKDMGLVHQIVPPEKLVDETKALAAQAAAKPGPAFESIKMFLRRDIGERMKQRDGRDKKEMVDIWYSEETWKNLQNIKIR